MNTYEKKARRMQTNNIPEALMALYAIEMRRRELISEGKPQPAIPELTTAVAALIHEGARRGLDTSQYEHLLKEEIE